MVKKPLVKSPFCVFTIECNGDFTNGLCQLLSFGLSVRHEKKLMTALYLILITSTDWFVMNLPPYADDLPSPVSCFSIKRFNSIAVYTEIT